MIMGHDVVWKSSTTNVYFGFPDMEIDEYIAFKDGLIDFDEIIDRWLCSPRTKWKVMNDRPYGFSKFQFFQRVRDGTNL